MVFLLLHRCITRGSILFLWSYIAIILLVVLVLDLGHDRPKTLSLAEPILVPPLTAAGALSHETAVAVAVPSSTSRVAFVFAGSARSFVGKATTLLLQHDYDYICCKYIIFCLLLYSSFDTLNEHLHPYPRPIIYIYTYIPKFLFLYFLFHQSRWCIAI